VNSTRRYDFLGCIVILIWSTCAAFVREMVNQCNGNYLTVVVCYNLIAAFVILSLSLMLKEYRGLKDIKDLKRFILLVHLNGFYDVAVALAVVFVVVIQYAILANYLWPILLVVFLSIFRCQKLNINSLIGCLLGFFAIFFLFGMDLFSSGVNILGITFGIVAALLWSLYSAMLNDEYSKISITIQGLAQLISGLWVLIISLILGKFNIQDFFVGWIWVLVYAVINMAIAYILWIHVVIKHADMQKFSSMLYILPILSLIISTIWFGGVFDWKIYFCSIIVLFGIWISRRGKFKGKCDKERGKNE